MDRGIFLLLPCIEQVQLKPCDPRLVETRTLTHVNYSFQPLIRVQLSLKHEFFVSLSPYMDMCRNIFHWLSPGLEMIVSLYGGELVEFGADAFETEGCLSHTPPPETYLIVCVCMHMKRRGFKFPPFLLPNWISPTLFFKRPSVLHCSLGEPPHQTACLFLIVSLRA